MKGYLANPRPVVGLDKAINENKNLEFYADIVNNRKLDAKEFFKYIKKYGDMYKINQKIEHISYNMSIMKANKIKLIIDYKKAEASKDNQKIEELKESFKNIKNVILSNEANKVESSNLFYDLQSKEFNKDEVMNLINDYLNGKELDKNEVKNLYRRIKDHLKDLDYKSVNDFNIKASNIEVISAKEVNQIIIILNYFIINLQNNSTTLDNLYSNYKSTLSNIKELNKKEKKLNRKKLNLESKKDLIGTTYDINEIEEEINEISKKITKEELELAKYDLSIKNFLPEISENLREDYKDNIPKLYISKSLRLKKYLKEYRMALEYITSFKIEIKNQDNLENLKINLGNYNIEEDYIIDIINRMRNIVMHYKNMNTLYLSDEKLDDMKKDYINKIYKLNN